MRIAFVIPGTGGGGVRSVVRIASGLAQRGHEILVLYQRSQPSLRERARSAYLGLRYGRRHDWLKSFPGRTQAYDALTADVVGPNDVLVGVGIGCALAISELPAACGTKVHNSRGVEPWSTERMARAWRLPFPRIVVGRHLVAAMRACGSRDPIFVAANGVDRTEYYPAVPEEQRVGVGTVYHGAAVKDPDTILATLARISAARPDVPLYIFGGHPRPRGLPRSATYLRLPRLAAARECYSRSLVWFCASRNEGFCNPLLEAMACNCAVVSTGSGGPADFIEPGVNGFLTPVGSPDDLAARVGQLLDDPDLRGRMVASSASVLDRFTWTHAVEQFEAALRAIAEQTADPPARQEAGIVAP